MAALPGVPETPAEAAPKRKRPWIIKKRYTVLQQLERGGFSTIHKAIDLRDCCFVAVKSHAIVTQWTAEKKASHEAKIRREHEIHADLSHENIAAVYDFCAYPTALCAVLEYCPRGSLYDVLSDRVALPETEARGLVTQILHGLEYLNQRTKPIVHMSLSPANILLDERGRAKITDFGSACFDGEIVPLSSVAAGCYWYLPPECFQGECRAASQIDVWSIGVLFYEMLYAGKPLFNTVSRDKMELGVGQAGPPTMITFPPSPPVASDTKELIRSCLTSNGAERLTALELVHLHSRHEMERQ